jgi:hypothetical protein
MGSSNRKGREIDSALRKKGFSRDKDGKHIWYYFTGIPLAGIKVMVSHGMMGKTIGASLISDMASQLHLSKEQFLDLIDCNLDADEYHAIIECLQQ